MRSRDLVLTAALGTVRVGSMAAGLVVVVESALVVAMGLVERSMTTLEGGLAWKRLVERSTVFRG